MISCLDMTPEHEVHEEKKRSGMAIVIALAIVLATSKAIVMSMEIRRHKNREL